MEKANNPYNLSPATLRALERFGPDKSSNRSSAIRLEPLPLPGADWELWAHMPKATLTEAVAVSLGIDPSAIKPKSGYVEPGKDFERRLKLACAFVSHAGPLKSLDALPPNHLLYGPATAMVSLPHFAEWALSMGWELPEKFPRLKAAPAQLATTSTAPATQNPLHVAVQRIVKSELQKHKPAPVVPTEPPAPPVVAAGASDGVEPEKAGPLPLTTGDIAFCFVGLRCNTEKEWKDLIGKGRDWVERCLVQPGTRGRGGAPKLWNPVCIGAALVREGHAKPNSVRAKFQTVHLLQPWLEAWKTYEADNFGTE